jgi:translation elongation factor EF-4
MPAPHKNITATCGGGDIDHKRKRLEKQKESGRMRQFRKASIPQEAFIAARELEG